MIETKIESTDPVSELCPNVVVPNTSNPLLPAVDEDWKLRSQHLAMVQAAIARMNQNSFVVKAWSATLTGAVLALAAQKPEFRALSWGAIAPPLLCCWLDAFYLRTERRFRELFEAIRGTPGRVAQFDMNPTPFVTGFSSWLTCLSRPIVLVVHAPVLLAAAVAARLITGR
jgi:hypothetical protein